MLGMCKISYPESSKTNGFRKFKITNLQSVHIIREGFEVNFDARVLPNTYGLKHYRSYLTSTFFSFHERVDIFREKITQKCKITLQ